MPNADNPPGLIEDTVTGLEPRAALDAAWPEIKALRNRAVLWTVPIVAALTGGIIVLAFGTEERSLLVLLLFPIVGILLSNRYVRQKTSERLMPSLAAAAGLEHSAKMTQQERPVLPPGLLPHFNRTKFEDVVTGVLGSLKFLSVEVTVADEQISRDSDGKREEDETIYFDGLCIVVTGLPEADPVIVATRQGRGGRALRRQMDGLTAHDLKKAEPGPTHPSHLDLYIAQASEPPFIASQDFLKRLTRVESLLEKKDRLFSAVRTEQVAAIAIETKRNRFALGGLLSTRQKLQSQMDHALQDFAWPVRVVEALVEAA